MSATDRAEGGIDLIALARGEGRPDLGAAIAEGRRQMEICNACRYCEGYCSVFPAMTFRRAFTDGDMIHLANLCHNCRGCYYACQYGPPHEFAVNVPRALAEIRTESWAGFVWPGALRRAFAHNVVLLSAGLLVAIAIVVALMTPYSTAAVAARSFYALMPHGTMVALFGSVFVFALVAMGLSVRRYWRETGSPAVDARGLLGAIRDVLVMKQLSGGHGEGCNYEHEDVFTNRRRWLHQAALYGFLLCFGATSAGTVLHYVFDQPAPYGLFSLPKLLGISGGVLLCVGTAGLLLLKRGSDRGLEARQARGMDNAFTVLLFGVSASGLALYALRGTGLLEALLVLHLGAVLALFATMPYSRMVHGLYRLAALIRHHHEVRTRRPME